MGKRLKNRAGNRETTVSGVMAALIPSLRPRGRILVVEDEGAVERSLGGLEVAHWRRLAIDGREASAWPPDGPFDAATLRLPRGKALLEMQLHAVAARLAPGATIWIYGANDEGIRSVPKRLAPLYEGGETIDTRRHCRVLQARRTDAPARGALADWAEAVPMGGEGEPLGGLSLTSWPGLFAHGRLDPASAMLIGALTPEDVQGDVLDFGCGAGALSLAARRLNPEVRITGLDIDALALHAARINLPATLLVLGDGVAALPKGARFDTIVSNPPFHAGHDEDFRALTGLIEAAPTLLKPDGTLLLVAQRTAGSGKAIRARLPQVTVAAEDSRFQVFRAKA